MIIKTVFLRDFKFFFYTGFSMCFLSFPWHWLVTNFETNGKKFTANINLQEFSCSNH